MNNDELSRRLELLRRYKEKGCLDPSWKLLLDYIDDLEEENKKLHKRIDTDYSKALENNLKIVEHYPTKDQIIIWIEEMSELTKELCKWYRVYDEFEGDIPDNLCKNMKGEVTDVTICLDQIKFIIDFLEVELMKIYKEKTDRQLERIEKENGK